MILLLLALKWYPVYIEKIDTDRADVFALSAAAALASPPANWTPTDHVWLCSSTKPAHRSAAFTVPTLAQWQEGVAICPPVQMPEFHYGEPCVLSSALQGRSDPGFLPSWNLQRVYRIRVTTFAWYYSAASASDAAALGQAEWIDGGVYALGRPLSSDEWARWQTGDPLLEVPIPLKPWQALANCLCEPDESVTYLSSTPYASRPPYPCRSE